MTKGLIKENSVQGLEFALKLVQDELNSVAKRKRQNKAIKPRTAELEKQLGVLQIEYSAINRVKIQLKTRIKKLRPKTVAVVK